MPTKARLVLKDCQVALSGIDGEIQGEEWRIRWIALVTLLRTVGYVLRTVDSKASSVAATAIDRKWQELNNDKDKYPIFWEFIDKERHNIAHEYEVNAGQGVTVVIGGPTHRSYTIKGGFFNGKDQVELAQEAIDFWDTYLDEIDEALRNA